MKALHTVAFVFAWYFLFGAGSNGPFTQVGPFASQSACQNYQAALDSEFHNGDVLTPCFSSTAK